jgi:RND superfamily putative drug exporter
MRFVFAKLGRAAARHPLPIVLVWVALVAAGYTLAVVGVNGQGLFDRVVTGAPEVPGSESQRGEQILGSAQDVGPSITLVLTGVDPTDPAVGKALPAIRGRLSAIDGVASVIDPLVLPGGLENPAAAPFVAVDGRGFLVVVELDQKL